MADAKDVLDEYWDEVAELKLDQKKVQEQRLLLTGDPDIALRATRIADRIEELLLWISYLQEYEEK